MEPSPLIAGVELGGTKTIAVLGRGSKILDRFQVATTTPSETLGAIAATLRAWRPAAIGIASFGPVAIHRDDSSYGQILATPKAAWQGADLLAALDVGVPTALSTDVIAAALAEGASGAAQGLADYVYVTVGTGIGMGIIAAGSPLTGRLHPEAGHMLIPRCVGDTFEGVCPFHGDCLEGLASGPAIAARAAMKGRKIPDDHECWPFVVDALTQGFANLRLTLATQTFVIGGGVAVARPWLAAAIAKRMDIILAGYLPTSSVVVAAALGDDAGPRGALLLGRDALS